MDHAKISELEKDFSFLGQVSIPAGAFKYLGVSNFPTSLMFWQKKLNPEDQGNRYNLTEANCFSMVALRYVTLGASEADCERSLSAQKNIQGLHTTKVGIDLLESRLRARYS